MGSSPHFFWGNWGSMHAAGCPPANKQSVPSYERCKVIQLPLSQQLLLLVLSDFWRRYDHVIPCICWWPPTFWTCNLCLVDSATESSGLDFNFLLADLSQQVPPEVWEFWRKKRARPWQHAMEIYGELAIYRWWFYIVFTSRWLPCLMIGWYFPQHK